MNQIPTWRLHLLRAAYVLIGLGMGSMTWASILTHSGDWDTWSAVVKCMLGALTALALLGILQPLRMLPLLLWEIAWKTIWLIAVAWPAWRSGLMDADTAQLGLQIIWVLPVYAVIPWRYVGANLLVTPRSRPTARRPHPLR